jgi:DNA-nicking Smr family endonuclease
MEFGKILDRWLKHSGGVIDKDKEGALEVVESPASRRRRLIRKSPEATIDLHGLTRDEAWNALTEFFSDAKSRCLEKVLIIHGKGNNSTEHPGHERYPRAVLQKLVQDFIERCPFLGESGYNGASLGGSGATWVLLKKDQRSL